MSFADVWPMTALMSQTIVQEKRRRAMNRSRRTPKASVGGGEEQHMKVAHHTPYLLRRAIFDFFSHKSQEENYRTAILHI